MSSRAEQKRAAREQREERERAAAARDGRRKRLAMLGAAVLAAIVIAGVLILVSQGDGDGPGSKTGGDGVSDAAFVNRLYEGIPQQGAALGDPDAPVTMVEFVDLQCPFCAQYTTEVLPELVRRYVRTGKVRMEMRPLTFIGDDSVRAANAAASAAEQDRMWQFSDLFYLNQGQENSGYATDEFLREIAVGARVKPGPVLAAANSNVTPPLIAQAQREAGRLGVESTPTFLVRQGDGELQPLAISALEVGEFTSQLDPLVGEG